MSRAICLSIFPPNYRFPLFASLTHHGPRNESCHSVFTRVLLQVLIQFKAQIARGYADSNAMRRRKFQQAVLATLNLLRRLVVLLPQQQYSQHTRGHDWLRQDRSCANLRRNGWKQGPGWKPLHHEVCGMGCSAPHLWFSVRHSSQTLRRTLVCTSLADKVHQAMLEAGIAKKSRAEARIQRAPDNYWSGQGRATAALGNCAQHFQADIHCNGRATNTMKPIKIR